MRLIEQSVEFDWDSSNLRHLARHHITREEFEQAMANDPIFLGFSYDSGEDRWSVLGATMNLRTFRMIFTLREDRIRPITGWEASKEFREFYFHSKAQ